MSHAPAKPARNRLAVLCAGLMVLWALHGYAREAPGGLLGLGVALTALATGLRRTLAPTKRAVIWTTLAIVVACLVANQTRISPPPDLPAGQVETSPYDRVVTVGVGLSLSALFFGPSALTQTVAAVGAMPVVMIAVLRDPVRLGGLSTEAILWTFFGLFALSAHLQRLPKTESPRLPRLRTLTGGIGAVVLAMVLAASMAEPLRLGARAGRERLFGRMTPYNPLMHRRQRGAALSVLPPSPEAAAQVRLIAAVRAPRSPGYLRESVYRTYQSGRWNWPSEGSEATSSEPTESPGLPAIRFPLIDPDTRRLTEPDAAETWRVRLAQPRQVAGLLLPGHAQSVYAYVDFRPRHTGDGMLLPARVAPPTYVIRVDRGGHQAAFKLPMPPDDPAYLAIPPGLHQAVSNWVAQCEGLQTAPDAHSAMRRIEQWFQTRFDYGLDPLPQGRSDPLERFMALRRGHCTLFASAAALMLRAVGIPTRVVAGYYVTERQALTDEWVARQRDGHAWLEAWDAAANRWRLVEPTPPGEMPGGDPPVAGWRLGLEWTRAQWQDLHALLQQINPLERLAWGGVWLWDAVVPVLRRPAFWLAWLTVSMGLKGWRVLRDRPSAAVLRRRRLIAAMRRIEARCSPAGLERRPAETWPAWGRRIRPRLPPARARKLMRRIRAYEHLRYDPDARPTAIERWSRR